MRPIDADALWSELDLGSEREDYFVSLRAVRELIEAAPTLDVVPMWIKVEDRLPDATDAPWDGRVLCVFSEEMGSLKNERRALDYECVRHHPKHFTHWMSLPELPEVE